MDIEFFGSETFGSTSEKYNESLQDTGPTVLRCTPHSKNKERTTDVKKEKTRNISVNAEVNLKVGGKGAKAGVKFDGNKETTETYKHHYFETCIANQRYQPPYSDVLVAVEWIPLEINRPNAKDDAGLTPELLFAVLL